MDTRKEMMRLDNAIYEMVDQSPGLAARYKALMGEVLGAVVILPRMPTLEDWAAAEKLARSRAE
jgi:hypothetical protein